VGFLLLKRQSAVSLRPTGFSQLVGQEPVVSAIKNLYEKQEPSAWLFAGPTGTGKTTVARILALSLQCEHGEFGEPCQDCIRDRSGFSIEEINASEMSGVEEIGQKAEAANYAPNGCRRRVFILDEAQRLSPASQNLLLKYFEDAPKTTVWMICTTEKHKILETLQRRCKVMQLKLLKVTGILELVKRANKALTPEGETPMQVKPLVEALWEAKIQSPALILNAVDNYVVAKMTAEDSVKNLGAESDTLGICASVMSGDWDAVKKETKIATSDELRGIRAGMAGYLRRALEAAIPGPRSAEIAKAINHIATVDSFTDATQGPATVGVLYELCQLFAGQELEPLGGDE
jgi:replication-associated recombination protein RarA